MTEFCIEIKESSESGYKPRTLYNAQHSDITIAFAVDFTTAGEQLTKRAAGSKYFPVSLMTDDPEKIAHLINHRVLLSDSIVINVAGNGVYTLKDHGISQKEANLYVYSVLKQLYALFPNISLIRSGGQTGIDISGLVAGFALGIPVEGLLPKGFVQRHADGKDVTQSKEDIESQIKSGALSIAIESSPTKVVINHLKQTGHPWDGSARPGFDMLFIASHQENLHKVAVSSAESKFWHVWIGDVNLEISKTSDEPFVTYLYKPTGIREDWTDDPKSPHPGIVT